MINCVKSVHTMCSFVDHAIWPNLCFKHTHEANMMSP